MTASKRIWDGVHERLRQGDPTAWDDLYTLLEGLPLEGSSGTPREDIVQDIAYRVVKTLFSGDRPRVHLIRDLRSFCLRIMVNDARQRVRVRRRAAPPAPQGAAEDVALAKDPEPDAKAAVRELQDAVRQCLAELSPGDRELLEAFHTRGLTLAEIAARERTAGRKVTRNALEIRLRRARQRLGRVLVRHGIVPPGWSRARPPSPEVPRWLGAAAAAWARRAGPARHLVPLLLVMLLGAALLAAAWALASWPPDRPGPVGPAAGAPVLP